MAYIFKKFFDLYRYTMDEVADPRVQNWFLLNSVFPILLIQILYIYLVKYVGPKYMEDRKPFNINKLLIVYNFCQILINGYIAYTIAKITSKSYNLHCNPVDYSNDPDAVGLARLQWLYFVTKVVDLLDTLFFILRKKYSQITFLHVYHHCSMIIFAWMLAKFTPGGQLLFGTLLNSFVHVFMYAYYMVTVWKKELRNNISVKRKITELQLIQFLLCIYVQVGPFFVKDCTYPKIIFLVTLPQNLFFFALFADFYIKNYILSKPKLV